MQLIRRGITRTVILTKHYAIKVPSLRGMGMRMPPTDRIWSFCRGVLANQSEIEWSEVEGVNPVLWSLIGIVNVSRRAEMPPDDAEIDYEAICPDFVPIGDRKPDNVGYVDGKLVWIDFDYSWNGLRDRH